MDWPRTEIDDKLNDLEASNPFLPPNTNATGALEVVPVHNDVDRKVKSDDDPRNRCRANQLGVAEEGGRAMVVAMEESCIETSAARPDPVDMPERVAMGSYSGVSS